MAAPLEIGLGRVLLTHHLYVSNISLADTLAGFETLVGRDGKVQNRRAA